MRRSQFNLSFLPEDFQNYILKQVKEEDVFFRISPPRKTKLGDYRYNPYRKTHAISVNIDLSEIQFLITFIHELAHKKCYDLYKGKVSSHGKEWKSLFAGLLVECKKEVELTPDWLEQINEVIINPKATSSDFEIEKGEDDFFVHELADETRFKLHSGRSFELIQKRRTRYLCKDLRNGKLYAVSGKALVKEIIN